MFILKWSVQEVEPLPELEEMNEKQRYWTKACRGFTLKRKTGISKNTADHLNISSLT